MDGAAFTRSALAEPAPRSSLGRSLALGLVVFALGMGFGVTTRDSGQGVDLRTAVHALRARAAGALGRAPAAAATETLPVAAAPPAEPARPVAPLLAAAGAPVVPPMIASIDLPVAEVATAPDAAATASDVEGLGASKAKKRRHKTRHARAAEETVEAAAPEGREAAHGAIREAVADAAPARKGYAPLSVLVPRAPRPSAAYAQACSGAPITPAVALAKGNYDAAAAQLACAQLRETE